MNDDLFPSIRKTISDFVYEEEGNIPRSKVLALGTMVLVLSLMMFDDAFAGHRSHSSHRSHQSHSSHSSGYGSHSSHQSHQSHSSHVSGSGHSSHSNASYSTGGSGTVRSGSSSTSNAAASAPKVVDVTTAEVSNIAIPQSNDVFTVPTPVTTALTTPMDSPVRE